MVEEGYDFIEIRDGNSESADLLGRHCSNIAPPAIISSGPVLHIKFVSDYAHQGAGFSLRYEIYKTGNTYLTSCFIYPPLLATWAAMCQIPPA
ncbi:Neuropilin-2 [Labeo rohita]|uniref:Neuropilin-2 n=1 Tax=Labeo rohita TaxID=84645 RepID=A0ABQ8MC98_LABRO|nr:Neuropilin-2 [Labeo rohita]